MEIQKAYAAHRPLLHFSVPQGWSNDPNGLIFHEGWYHLYYQHYPHAPRWDDMHWGHARSRDLLRWEHRPIALYPNELGTIFSGCMVYDRENTSGLGTKENPPMVAVFTQDQGARRVQVQSIAWSLDGGETFQMYEGNPIITCPEKPDFRDPKVFWNEGLGRWSLVLAAGKELFFYASEDLKTWEQTGVFADPAEDKSVVWECPDLFPLGDRWILSLSLGARRGKTAAMIYYVGAFDGAVFTPDEGAQRVPLDGGYDDYAAVTFADTPGRTLLLGWMRGFNADDTPETGFRGSMTVARELSLIQRPGQPPRLGQLPCREVLEAAQATAQGDLAQGRQEVALEKTPCLLQIDAKEAFSLTLENGTDRIGIAFDPAGQSLTVDTTACGVGEKPTGLQKKERVDFLPGEEGVLIVLDVTSVEVFTQSGCAALTAQYLAQGPFDRMVWQGEQGPGKYTLSTFAL